MPVKWNMVNLSVVPVPASLVAVLIGSFEVLQEDRQQTFVVLVSDTSSERSDHVIRFLKGTKIVLVFRKCLELYI